MRPTLKCIYKVELNTDMTKMLFSISINVVIFCTVFNMQSAPAFSTTSSYVPKHIQQTLVMISSNWGFQTCVMVIAILLLFLLSIFKLKLANLFILSVPFLSAKYTWLFALYLHPFFCLSLLFQFSHFLNPLAPIDAYLRHMLRMRVTPIDTYLRQMERCALNSLFGCSLSILEKTKLPFVYILSTFLSPLVTRSARKPRTRVQSFSLHEQIIAREGKQVIHYLGSC